MSNKLNTSIFSEIGTLEGVILHKPGKEIENMTPQNIEKALYSDILNINIVDKEYAQFSGALQKITNTYQVKDLLTDVLTNDTVKEDLVRKILKYEKLETLQDDLLDLSAPELARQLIEGVRTKVDNLSKYLEGDRYALQPLHNFFFTRDASVSVYDEVLICRMANKVRFRESMIMEAIFNHSSQLSGQTFNLDSITSKPDELYVEGGDVLIARDDVLLIGMGGRTSSKAVDFLIEKFKKTQKTQHVFIQELPLTPESFIHLDMVFTFLDKNKVMTFDPLIFQSNSYKTIHIIINHGTVKIQEEVNLIQGLKKLGMDLETVSCGGTKDYYIQEREQWHSGANFFALAPGKVIGYERNAYTIEELNKNDFEVLKAKDIVDDKINPNDYDKYVITIEGSELARGGGGCRCMTMPVKRKPIEW